MSVLSMEVFKNNEGLADIPDEWLEIYLESAQELVEDYLGYDILDRYPTKVPFLLLDIINSIARIKAAGFGESNSLVNQSVTDPNTGSRTFVSYTNFSKYLSQLDGYRDNKIDSDS